MRRSARLLDADHVARGIAEGAVADAVRLVDGLLGDLGPARLHSVERRVDIGGGEDDARERAFAIISAMVRCSSSVMPGSAFGG